MSDPGRAHNGPTPGTRVYTVELPPGSADEQLQDALYAAFRNIARQLVPESFVTTHVVMGGRGKGAGISNNLRDSPE